MRNARTRTLIQLGGLLEKVGLVEAFAINLGSDLQKDSDMQEPMAALTGALLELASQVRHQDFSHPYLAKKGLAYLSQQQAHEKDIKITIKDHRAASVNNQHEDELIRNHNPD